MWGVSYFRAVLKSHRVPSTPVTADAVPPSPAGEGLVRTSGEAKKPSPGGRWPPFMGGRMRGGRDLWFAPTKAFSLGRRCHAFWRDGCGALPLSGQSGNSYLVPSTPVTADAVPPSPAGEGLTQRNRPRTSEKSLLPREKAYAILFLRIEFGASRHASPLHSKTILSPHHHKILFCNHKIILDNHITM